MATADTPKPIFMILGLVAVVGLVLFFLRGGPEPHNGERAGTATTTLPEAGEPGPAEITTATAPPAAPAAPTDIRTAATPGTRAPDPRLARADGKRLLTEPIRITRTMHSAETTPGDDVSAIGTALRYYRNVYKENPEGGLNEEIVDRLTGNNPQSIVVLPPDHPAINARGELVDRWGTPYFFHGLTATVMEVQSAGPDKKIGTGDDISLGIDEGVRRQLGLVVDP